MIERDPLWYKDAVIYELHVRAFQDSNADGIGDFKGLISRLDYLRDLGVTAIWILPFYPSPLKDDGYDIADYTSVNPSYGTLRDVKQFIRAAHDRGLRVITELVCNHTSDQHPWFQRARRAKPGSAHRDFYVWSDNPDKYKETRIIFKDFEPSNWSWDPVANAYYWHRFYHHQPDLNFESPHVQKALLQTLDYWLDMGIDGLRLDAIPYLYEREGTNCENLPETHEFLKKLRRHVDQRYGDRLLLAEANQWSEDAAAYFGDGDECHMNFHFPVMPRMYMALRMEDRRPIVDIMESTPPIPETAQWGMFLRNHDELTLEMVTDEERDYMYRVYAHDPQTRINLGIRRRLAPLLSNNRRRIELMNALLFSMPGTPVLYYGDELGMGDNPYLGDRNGVRTPMQWSPDRNAGFSDASPHRLYLPVIQDAEYHFQTVNVEAQQANPSSLLWWMKRLIALRRQHQAFSRGTIEFLHPDNRKVLAFLRRHGDETLLVVVNLSRFVQYVELDLSAYRGARPVELFSRSPFPQIGELPYLLTLGPHAFYWFSLEPVRVDGQAVELGTDPAAQIPVLTIRGSWERLADGSDPGLGRLLPNYLQARRWFGGKARTIRQARVTGSLPVQIRGGAAHLALVRVEYAEGDDETYVLPLATATGAQADHLLRDVPHAVVARLQTSVSPVPSPERRAESPPSAEELVLYDALVEPETPRALMSTIAGRRAIKGKAGEIVATTTRALDRNAAGLDPHVVRGEQSNTSVVFGDRYILKLFRRVEPGTNPDAEIGTFLTERGFANTAPVAGTLELDTGGRERALVAILNGFVPNALDAWTFTLEELSRHFERALEPGAPPATACPSTSALLDIALRDLPGDADLAVGPYLAHAELLARRTGEMHLALASGTEPAFVPEDFSTLYQRSLYQGLRAQATGALDLLKRQLGDLDQATRADAQRVLDHRGQILERFAGLNKGRMDAQRTRHHGDYHLGQVLWSGRDFVILDFEGEPARPIGERRLKRSPMRDVAGMLRSFHYASYAAMTSDRVPGVTRPEDRVKLEPWARCWHLWVSAAFLRTYLKTIDGAAFMPSDRGQLDLLLDVFLLEKALYELSYELNNRPTWARLPLRGILQLLDAEDAS